MTAINVITHAGPAARRTFGMRTDMTRLECSTFGMYTYIYIYKYVYIDMHHITDMTRLECSTFGMRKDNLDVLEHLHIQVTEP